MGAAYSTTVSGYTTNDARAQLGHLVASVAQSGIATQRREQINAWEESLPIIESTARALEQALPDAGAWTLLLEYEVPRRARRPDLILIARDLIFVIEFKIGCNTFKSVDRWQARDYALNLSDFHRESVGRRLVPILVATHAAQSQQMDLTADALVAPVQCVNSADLARRIIDCYLALTNQNAAPIEAKQWTDSAYRPTPSIVEAAQTLFCGNRVVEISHGFATNLTSTTRALVEAIASSRANSLRTICFVTGIPGAGKTLTGLSAAHDPQLRRNGEAFATFLSGNGPLISIIHESLVRDSMARGMRRQDADHRVSAFIHDVHRFMREHGIEKPSEPPPEHVVIFDEAQRAWDAARMRKKRKLERSEAALMLDIMERAKDWSTVIALVGGGQEINDGEAGLEEWGRALTERSTHWNVLASPEVMQGGESVAGHRLFTNGTTPNLTIHAGPDLHLVSNVRSARAQWLGPWVNRLLHSDRNPAASQSNDGEFPVVMTRKLEAAKAWVRDLADANERSGLVASSGGLRLRAHGIEVSSGFRSGYPYDAWFLDDRSRVLSSSQLEVAATEFECQGLELDWTIVCWGGDMLIDPRSGQWRYRAFRGAVWQDVHKTVRQQLIANKYRVLLTRARRGIAIWIPEGDPSDPTRCPQTLNATAEYVSQAGVSMI